MAGYVEWYILTGMAAKLIDGAGLAEQEKLGVRRRAAQLAESGRQPALVAVLIGSTPAGELYASRQAQACESVGISYQLRKMEAETTQAQAENLLKSLSDDSAVTGIMLHLPVPGHLDATELQYTIDPVKDVEGVNPANIGYVVYGHTLIAPCTALAVIELIESTGVDLRGAEAVVVGASEIAGKPIALLLTQRLATVTLCHIATRDLWSHTRRADVLVVAVGKAGLIGADYVKKGAIVIDVGINRVASADGSKKTVGDVDFEGVSPVAGFITPVPGGVGPMTVAMLLKNTLRSAELLAKE
jgi:methylenetetrahydrofolate dehydrogenase (NADP+)/methenyltetrahydrofolate cyclohydrolase